MLGVRFLTLNHGLMSTDVYRWAAKEACRKACMFMGLRENFKRILILPSEPLSHLSDRSYRPLALIMQKPYNWPLPSSPSTWLDGTASKLYTGEQFDRAVQQIEGQWCELSISHDGDYVVATVLAPEMKIEPNVEVKPTGT